MEKPLTLELLNKDRNGALTPDKNEDSLKESTEPTMEQAEGLQKK